MKLCRDCVYCIPFVYAGVTEFYHCALRSRKEYHNPVDVAQALASKLNNGKVEL